MNITKIHHSAISLCVLAALIAAPAIAEGPQIEVPMPTVIAPGISNSMINGSALSGIRGRFAVNMAAGDSNAQTNAAAIAIGLSDSSVGAYAGVAQRADARNVAMPGVATRPAPEDTATTHPSPLGTMVLSAARRPWTTPQ